MISVVPSLFLILCVCAQYNPTELKMAEDKNRYKYMENVLTDISGAFVSLPDALVKRNNQILREVVQVLTDKMKKADSLFNSMFRRVFYGGSFYDGLRVGKPDEFDLDFLLTIPKLTQPTLTTSNTPGFVHLQLKNLDAWAKQPEAKPFKNFEKLFDDKRYLDTKNVLRWMQGVLDKAMNDFPTEGNKWIIQNHLGRFEVSKTKSGPALTLLLSGPNGIKIDIDLVTCFVFDKDKWPKDGFKANPVMNKPEFFIVPKEPKLTGSEPKRSRYWRLSFQEQERELMEGKGRLKPTLRLIKKLRDNLKHSAISSYYIKTVFLGMIDQRQGDPTFWNSPLSNVFMAALKAYRDAIENKKIQYYWNKKNNLIGTVNPVTLSNISNRLNVVIRDIERNTAEPKTIAKFLLDSSEYDQFMKGDCKVISARNGNEVQNSCIIA